MLLCQIRYSILCDSDACISVTDVMVHTKVLKLFSVT